MAFGELGDLERQSLLVAIQKLDEAAQSLEIDAVAELKATLSLMLQSQGIQLCRLQWTSSGKPN
jgi:hypothetical protein